MYLRSHKTSNDFASCHVQQLIIAITKLESVGALERFRCSRVADVTEKRVNIASDVTAREGCTVAGYSVVTIAVVPAGAYRPFV